MVYKTQKHGIRTGSTVKNWFPNISPLRQTPYLRVKVTEHMCRVHNKDCLTGLFCRHFTECQCKHVLNGVEYSLNKRKRWNLPEFMAENILSENYDETEPEVQIVLRHFLPGLPSACKYACSSRGTKKHVGTTNFYKMKAAEHGYFNEDTILNDMNGFTSRNKRQQPGIEVDRTFSGNKGEFSGFEGSCTEVKSGSIARYEFVYPSSINKYLTHQPRYSGPFIDYWDKHYDHQDQFNRHRRKKKLRRYINESLTDIGMGDC